MALTQSFVFVVYCLQITARMQFEIVREPGVANQAGYSTLTKVWQAVKFVTSVITDLCK